MRLHSPITLTSKLGRIAGTGLLALTLVTGAALAQPTLEAQAAAADPALEQTVTSDEESVRGEPVVLDAGHVDLGPRLVDDEWIFSARDDSAAPPVWRYPEDIVFHIHDTGVQALPDSGDYDFTGAGAGENVWVVPQVEIPGVVWLGWNTQDPAVVENAPDGVTLRINEVQGPGQMTMFLQPGNFQPPQVLVDPAVDAPQDIFIETNVHTHINWVFTEPGVYLVNAEFLATTTDGQQRSAAATLRFSVGDETDPEQARQAVWADGAGPVEDNVTEDVAEDGAAEDEGETAPEAESSDATATDESVDPSVTRATEEDNATSAVLPWVIGGAIVVIIILAAIFFGLRSRKANREQEAAFEKKPGNSAGDQS